MSRCYTNYIKGIATILVIASHVGGCYGCRYFTPLGGIGVAIFLILSGYGLNESYKKQGLTHYWSKKILRIFVPYTILSTILFVEKDVAINNFLLNIFGISTWYWYVSFLLKQYLIFYFITRFAFKHRLILMTFISFLCLVFCVNIQAEQAFSFLIGVAISNNFKNINNYYPRKFIAATYVFLFLGIIFLLIKQLDIVRAHENDFIYNIVQCMIKLPLGLSVIMLMRYLPI